MRGTAALDTALHDVQTATMSMVSRMSESDAPWFVLHDAVTAANGKHLLLVCIQGPTYGTDPLCLGVIESGGSAPAMAAATDVVLVKWLQSWSGYGGTTSDAAPAALNVASLLQAKNKLIQRDPTKC